MILRPQQIALMAIGMPTTPCNGGGSSDSSNATTTTNADQRLSVGSGVGATASSGGSVTLNVNQIDEGAVSQAFGLGAIALNDVASIGTASMSASQHSAEMAINGILAGAQDSQAAYAGAAKLAANAYANSSAQAASAYSGASDQVASAYQDAKTGDQKILVIGAMLIAGIAVAAPFLAKAKV